jgi:hypothetical protein
MGEGGMEAEDGASRWNVISWTHLSLSLTYDTGRHSWAGGSKNAAPGPQGYAWGQAQPGLQIGVGRKPTAIFQHTKNCAFLCSRAAVDHIHVFAWSGEARVCRLASSLHCVHLAVELCTTRVSLCGLTLDPIPMVSHCLLHYLPPTAGNVLVVALSAF